MSVDRRTWFLGNASPDVLRQIEDFADLHPRDGRASPLGGVLLTDAELDHTLGLLLLREGRGMTVHATVSVWETLRDGNGLLRTLERYCPVEWVRVEPGEEVPLGGEHSGLSYRAFDVPTTKRARFGAEAGAVGRVVGYRLRDGHTGGVAVYLPGAQYLGPEVLAELDGASALLIDGTCWHDDELRTLGLAEKTSRAMGHVPVAGQEGSLEVLSELDIPRKVYVHLNNTNPLLLDDSAERALAESRGMEIATDGLELKV